MISDLIATVTFGLVPKVHPSDFAERWIVGTSPTMTGFMDYTTGPTA